MTRCTTIIALVFCLCSCGCGSLPYHDRILWQDAAVVNDSDTDRYRFLTVSPGKHWVVEVTDGHTGGLWTTAHSSHDSLYLILDKRPVRGEEYTFSFSEGNLDYDGFAGYWFSVIDTNKVASATMRVRGFGLWGMRAEIKAQIPYRREGSGDTGLYSYSVDGFWTFREKSAKAP